MRLTAPQRSLLWRACSEAAGELELTRRERYSARVLKRHGLIADVQPPPPSERFPLTVIRATPAGRAWVRENLLTSKDDAWKGRKPPNRWAS